jgi:hypothetical protein
VLCAPQGRGERVGMRRCCLGTDRKRPKGWRSSGARGAAETKEGQEAGKQGPLQPARPQVNDRFSLTSSTARGLGIGDGGSSSRIPCNA